MEVCLSSPLQVRGSGRGPGRGCLLLWLQSPVLSVLVSLVQELQVLVRERSRQLCGVRSRAGGGRGGRGKAGPRAELA